MITKGRIIIALLLVALCTAASFAATSPEAKLPYQKKLTAAPIVSTTLKPVQFTFTLWNEEVGGTQEWIDVKTISVNSATRLISTVLGDGAPLSASYFNQQLWVQVDIGGAVIGTREKLATVPYAMWSAVSDVSGVVGPQGPIGNPGPDGNKGATGDKGPAGNIGPDGNKGPTGDKGPIGNSGPDGNKGPTGDKGPTGNIGPVGPAGPALPDARFGNNPFPAYPGRGRECTLGEIILTAASVVNGIPAKGQILPISQNTALFSLLGTNFGGDGRTTFALPDLRNVAPNGLTYSICTEGIFPARY